MLNAVIESKLEGILAETGFEELRVAPCAQENLCEIASAAALVLSARSTAARDFSGHWRKVPAGSAEQAAPYFAHLERVAQIVSEYTDRAEAVAAAYLHDHLEDLPELWNKTRLSQKFGAAVTELVDWVTQQDKDAPWQVRNDDYAKRIRQAPVEAMIISAADKISNMEDLVSWMKRGFRVDSVVSCNWLENSAKFHELLHIVGECIPRGLRQKFESVLAAFDELGSVQMS